VKSRDVRSQYQCWLSRLPGLHQTYGAVVCRTAATLVLEVAHAALHPPFVFAVQDLPTSDPVLHNDKCQMTKDHAYSKRRLFVLDQDACPANPHDLRPTASKECCMKNLYITTVTGSCFPKAELARALARAS